MKYRGVLLECDLLSNFDKGLVQVIYTLFDAIVHVDMSYIKFQEPEKKLWVSHLERVFANELYHIWSLVLKEQKLFGENKYVLNAEINKNMNYFGSINDGEKFPDMVLHHSQGDNWNQGIICEVKRKEGLNYKSFREDIDKISIFLQEGSAYKFAVGAFILVGEKIDVLYKHVTNLKKRLIGFTNSIETIEIQKKIICVAYNDENLMFTNLYSMIQNTKNKPNNLYCVSKDKKSSAIKLEKSDYTILNT